jgi:hypothetical protein
MRKFQCPKCSMAGSELVASTIYTTSNEEESKGKREHVLVVIKKAIRSISEQY